MVAGLITHALHLRGIGEVMVCLSEAHGGAAIGFVLGELKNKALVRIQSRCVYGEVFGSVHCDCKDQLDAAWLTIKSESSGIVVYLDQEGRGAGAIPKAKAYRNEQLNGIDTFATYSELGLPPDLRGYDQAADLLKHFGLSSVRLLTNNPEKALALCARGIEVQRLGLRVPSHNLAKGYLAAKRVRGHDL